MAGVTRYRPLRRSWLQRKPRRYVVPPEILAYWAWIREQQCVCCSVNGSTGLIDAAHVGTRGLAQKSSGWEVLPLCKFHHRRGFPYSHHTLGKRFWSFHGLDRGGLIRMYRLRYFGLTGLSAAIEDRGFDREGL
jgi:hypothetical protein